MVAVRLGDRSPDPVLLRGVLPLLLIGVILAGGYCCYAETARTSPRGMVGRGIEGAVDAVLKVFGI